jgi:hypothetical protein
VGTNMGQPEMTRAVFHVEAVTSGVIKLSTAAFSERVLRF